MAIELRNLKGTGKEYKVGMDRLEELATCFLQGREYENKSFIFRFL